MIISLNINQWKQTTDELVIYACINCNQTLNKDNYLTVFYISAVSKYLIFNLELCKFLLL